MADLSKIRKNGVDYDIKDSVARAAIEELQNGDNIDLSGYVQSVNGVTPDENGNVDVAGGSGCDVSVEGEKLFLSDSDNDGVYELIDTIVLEEEVKIDIKRESDGTSYKFKGVMVFMTTEGNVTATNLYYYSSGTAVGLSYIGNKTTTAAGYASYECIPYMGYWLPKWKNGWNNTESGAGTDRQNNHRWRLYSSEQYPYITRVMTTGVLPAGTTIEIWGVRA